ncbi:uncharacterized protein LOC103705013 [Phoenix dactylifera]|uniref:Uncharacterized protein LOC103705013 n=1 Tax=Phoenix dactylifera TaxID=42345 RepID=A0A8B7BWH2_PHODC|nr:uncharacterized protein LOC103705013 [Phoenix dactylifera]XP_008786800.2 uncharacterized protein LOC103705013 [Phoenix dactylifera]
MATLVSLCASNLLTVRNKSTRRYIGLRPVIQLRCSPLSLSHTRSQSHLGRQSSILLHRLVVLAITKGSTKSSQSDEKIPSWARPDSDEPPPWARDEGNDSTSPQTIAIPFYVYLVASAVTAIAAVGSVFEYVNQKPVFGVLSSDSVFYAPLLGFFAFTGIPTSAFLWFKSVQAANKASEEQDRRDGYR